MWIDFIKQKWPESNDATESNEVLKNNQGKRLCRAFCKNMIKVQQILTGGGEELGKQNDQSKEKILRIVNG